MFTRYYFHLSWSQVSTYAAVRDFLERKYENKDTRLMHWGSVGWQQLLALLK